MLGRATGLAFSGGNLYISEALASRVREFSTTGTLLGTFDEHGSGNGKSFLPWGIATDPTTGNRRWMTETGGRPGARDQAPGHEPRATK